MDARERWRRGRRRKGKKRQKRIEGLWEGKEEKYQIC